MSDKKTEAAPLSFTGPTGGPAGIVGPTAQEGHIGPTGERIAGSAMEASPKLAIEPVMIGYADLAEIALIMQPSTISMRVKIYPPEHAHKDSVKVFIDAASLR